MERYTVARRSSSKRKNPGFLAKWRRKYVNGILNKRSWITNGYDLNVRKNMIVFFILTLLTAKAKENPEYLDLLHDLLEIEKEMFLDGIARRIFMSEVVTEDQKPDNLTNEEIAFNKWFDYVKKEKAEEDAKEKKYHENGRIPTFEEYYKKKYGNTLTEADRVENEKYIYQEWKWYKEYSEKLQANLNNNKQIDEKVITEELQQQEDELKHLQHELEGKVAEEQENERYEKLEVEVIAKDLDDYHLPRSGHPTYYTKAEQFD